MGKGDGKTKRGKIFKKSYGRTRPTIKSLNKIKKNERIQKLDTTST